MLERNNFGENNSIWRKICSYVYTTKTNLTTHSRSNDFLHHILENVFSQVINRTQCQFLLAMENTSVFSDKTLYNVHNSCSSTWLHVYDF